MKIQVHDHGYVEFVEAWGVGKDGGIEGLDDMIRPSRDHEVGIIEAARQSTQGNFRGWDEDARLLSYLYRNNHATPFEFAGMVIEVQAPIFVFREWHRHRTQSYNETSARYSPLEPLYYLPSRERIMQSSSSNKQAGVAPGAKPIEDPGVASIWQGSIEKAYQTAELTYQALLRAGVPKEVARCVMPVGHYSKMRASANLRNWLAFMTLRCDPKAQKEIRDYAWAVAEIIKQHFPQTYELWAQNN